MSRVRPFPTTSPIVHALAEAMLDSRNGVESRNGIEQRRRTRMAASWLLEAMPKHCLTLTLDAALAAQPAPPLDVERLAEALALTEVGCWATGARHSPEQDNQQHDRDAIAIAAEYARLSEPKP